MALRARVDNSLFLLEVGSHEDVPLHISGTFCCAIMVWFFSNIFVLHFNCFHVLVYTDAEISYDIFKFFYCIKSFLKIFRNISIRILYLTLFH